MKLIIALIFIIILSTVPVIGKYEYVCPRCNYFISCDSHSMSPTLNCTDKLVMEDLRDNDYRLNDIIWFHRPNNKDKKVPYIIHRIVGSTKQGFITKGDNNSVADPWRVKKDKIRFKVIKINNEKIR